MDLCCPRYVSIIHPTRSCRAHRRQRLWTLFVMIWLLALLIASPNLYLLRLHLLDRRSSSYVCGLSDHWIHSRWIIVYKYAESIVFFFLPAVIQVSVFTQIHCSSIDRTSFLSPRLFFTRSFAGKSSWSTGLRKLVSITRKVRAVVLVRGIAVCNSVSHCQ